MLSIERYWTFAFLVATIPTCRENSQPPSASDAAAAALTCSASDRFTFVDVADAIGPALVGVDAGTVIADSSSLYIDAGLIRKYFFAGGRGTLSATSSDGFTFALESGTRLAEGQAGHQKVVRLSDGRIRLYTGNPGLGGIVSFISTDELTFTLESGTRITAQAAGMTQMSHLTVADAPDGGYRGFFSDLPIAGGAPVSHYFRSATSGDLLNWVVETGIRVGPDAGTLTGSAEQPHALARGNGCVTVFYFRNTGAMGIYYSTSADGVTFSTETALGVSGNGADILQRADGGYFLYYDTGTPSTGFKIRVGTLSLVSP